MWTKRSHFAYVYLKVKRFRLPLVMPLHILWELLDALEDVFSLFGRIRTKADPAGVVRAASGAVHELTKMGRFDLVDVEAGHGGERVIVKVSLR